MIRIKENHSLKAYNTFGIDAKARFLVEYDSEEDLNNLLKKDSYQKLPFLIIGGGSNLLFLNDFDGVVYSSNITGIEVTKETETEVFVKAGAAIVWDDLVNWCVEQNYGGLENLSLIPGVVGATPVQNIGAYGVEIKDVLHEAHALEIATGKIRTFSNEECQFAYRDSVFKKELKNRYIFTYVTFKLSKQPQFKLDYGNIQKELVNFPEINLKTIRQAIISIRESKLPDTEIMGNAGSFFKNPVIPSTQADRLRKEYPDMPSYKISEEVTKIPAAWLIDQCGWKGQKRGNAGVHKNQPLVLVNLGGACGKEIYNLSEEIMKSVAVKFGIHLEREVLVVS